MKQVFRSKKAALLFLAIGLGIALHFQNCAPLHKSQDSSRSVSSDSELDLDQQQQPEPELESELKDNPEEGEGESNLQSTNPCIPIRAVGVNEGFTAIPGYNLGQPTTVTADDLADRMMTNQRPGAIKIWPIYQTLTNGDLDPVFTDPRLKVIVYRPFDNQLQTPPRPAAPQTACGQTAYHSADIQTNYGQVAAKLYQRFGHLKKTIILTGWEADNQIKFISPNCQTPTTQAAFDSYRALLQTRQNSVQNVRQQNANKLLRVFHAVEINQVPTTTGSRTIVERVVKKMNPKPDFISFSSWSSDPNTIKSKLDKIKAVSQFPKDRIFVGEWGCRTNNPNRINCFTKHAQVTLNWGARLWFVWAYAVPGGWSYGLINSHNGQETSNGFSVVVPLSHQWWAPRTCN